MISEEEKNKRLNYLFETYPELERVSEICVPLIYLTLKTKIDDDENFITMFEKLEAILKEGVEQFGKKKIINSRYLYCELPIWVDKKLYNTLQKKGIHIPRLWRIKNNV